jgi:hypothetical protein
MFLNVYLIRLRCTRGSTIKRTVQLGGATPDGKIPLSLMTKGERFIRCKGHRHESRGSNGHKMQRTEAWFQGGMTDMTSVLHDMMVTRCRGQRHGSRGSMSDMTSVLHDMISVLHQSVAINAKGRDC